MIALFHSIPKLEEIKKNYLWFDELQTSEKFIKGSLAMITQISGSKQVPEAVDGFLREFDFLLDHGIVKGNEDIERKLIPEIGDFDYSIIKYRFNSRSDKGAIPEPILEFWSHLIDLRDAYGIEIIGKTRKYHNPNIPSFLGVKHHRGALENIFHNLNPFENVSKKLLQRVYYTEMQRVEDTTHYINEFAGLYSRFAAIVLNKQYKDNNYYPLVTDTNTTDWRTPNPHALSALESLKSKAVTLVIQKFPVPDDTVSWERLIDFKNDPDTRNRILALRSWMADISQRPYTLSEIDDKLESLLADYTIQFKKHHIQYNGTWLETILVPVGDAIFHSLNMDFGKAAGILFQLFTGRYQLFEAETKFAGREVAYIHKVRNFLKK